MPITSASATPPPIGSRRRLALARAAITLVFLANGTGIGLWVGHIAWLQERHGLDHRQLSLILLSLAAGALVTMSTAGWLTARFGSRACTVVAGILFCLLLPLPYLAPGLATLALAAILLGAANGAMDVAMNAHGAAVERARQQPTMSSFHGFFSLGGVLGSGVAGFCLRRGIEPDHSMLVLAPVLLGALLLAGSGLLEDARDEGGAAGLVRPNAALLLLGVFAFLAMGSEGAVLDWLGVFLAGDLGASLALAAAGTAVFSAAMTCGRLTGDRLVRRFGDIALLRASAGLAATGCLLLLAAPWPWLALVAAIPMGFGLANAVPILFGAGTRVPGMAPGQGLATVAIMGYAAFLTAPPLIGTIADASSLRLALGLVLAALLVVAAGAQRMTGMRPARASATGGGGPSG